MPDITQITDSINKKYVQLPDGTFAEKIVVVNSDGTAISAGGGGGGGSTNTTVIQHPEDGSTLTITLAAPTLGKVYRYADNFVASGKDGTVQFVPTLLANQNTSYFIGRVIGPGGVGGVSGISEGPSYSTTSVTSAINIWEFTYIGETVFNGQTFAMYNTTHYRNLGG